MKKILFLFSVCVFFITNTYAQTPVTNKSQLDGVFVFTDPTPIYEGEVQVGMLYNTGCMWKARKKRCRGHDGICTKGHVSFDMSEDLLEAILVEPDDEIDVETAPQVAVELSIGIEEGEATIFIEAIE